MNKSELKKIICVKRLTGKFSITKMDKSDFVSFCVTNIFIEFNNLVGFMDLMTVIGVFYEDGIKQEELTKKTRNLFGIIYDNVECYIANIPYYEDIEKTKEVVTKLLISEINKEN
jgi:hypothetical protein